MANFCSQCGSPLDVNTGLCPKCAPKVYPNFCALCGSPIDPLTGLCPGCGAAAAPLDVPAAPAVPAEPEVAPSVQVVPAPAEEVPEAVVRAPVPEIPASQEEPEIGEPAEEPAVEEPVQVLPEEPEVFYCDCCGAPLEPGVAACPLCGGSPTKDAPVVIHVEETPGEEIVSEEQVREASVEEEPVAEIPAREFDLPEEPVAEAIPEEPVEEAVPEEPSAEMPKFCMTCGSAIDQQTGMCVVCGAVVAPVANVAESVREVAPAVPEIEQPVPAEVVPAEEPEPLPVVEADPEPVSLVDETVAMPIFSHPKFCELCGTPTDPVTGACPKCSAPAVPAPAEKPKPAPRTNFCEFCGTPTDPVTGTCPKCSAAATAPVAAPAPVVAPASVAEPAPKKKSSAVTAVIAIFMSLFVFLFGVACVASLTVRQAVSEKGAANMLNAVEIPFLLNSAFDVGEYGDDFYEPIIEYMEEDHGIEITSQQLDAVLEKTSLKTFIAGKVATYGNDLISGDDKFTITKKEVADVLKEEENVKIIEEEFGEEVPDEALDTIAKWLINEESIEKISVSSLRKENSLLASLASFFLSYPAAILLAVLALLFAFIIILRDPSRGVLATGINLIVIGSLFGLAFLTFWALPLIVSFEGMMGVVFALGGGALKTSALLYAVIFGVGVLTLIVRKIVLVLRKH